VYFTLLPILGEETFATSGHLRCAKTSDQIAGGVKRAADVSTANYTNDRRSRRRRIWY
jgi:hypothetical protein